MPENMNQHEADLLADLVVTMRDLVGTIALVVEALDAVATGVELLLLPEPPRTLELVGGGVDDA
jgi:hypothetical protein